MDEATFAKLYVGANEAVLLNRIDALKAERDRCIDANIDLLHERDRLATELAEVRKVLRTHGIHRVMCAKNGHPAGPCDCGIAAALADEGENNDG